MRWCGQLLGAPYRHVIPSKQLPCTFLAEQAVFVWLFFWYKMPSSSKVSFSHSRISLLLCALNDFNCLLSGLSFNWRHSITGPIFLSSFWAWQISAGKRGWCFDFLMSLHWADRAMDNTGLGLLNWLYYCLYWTRWQFLSAVFQHGVDVYWHPRKTVGINVFLSWPVSYSEVKIR